MPRIPSQSLAIPHKSGHSHQTSQLTWTLSLCLGAPPFSSSWEEGSQVENTLPVQRQGLDVLNWKGTGTLLPGMPTSCLACLPRTLSGLSQTHSSQQHAGLSQTARLYPAPAASGQLTSNALPMGPGPERRDGAPQAAYLDHPSSSWGKDALSPGPHRASFSPPRLPRFTLSERLSCHPVPHPFSQ